ncbi:MAG: hypothetical protein P1P89_00460 [Desulfobacterales bacterium]|nr:hypothetical protein [Desulfobacterales bacterium]
MVSLKDLNQSLTNSERRFIARLDTAPSIQGFLDKLTYSNDGTYRCPLRVLRERTGHCFDGALFAAALLSRLGHPPLILEMLPNDRDDDHLLALFKRDGHWGALANSNFAGLRFREPIYRNLRELVMSYFEQFYNVACEKTLRGYTRPLNLKAFDKHLWITQDKPLEQIAQRLDRIGRVSLLSEEMIKNLSPVDKRSWQAGLLGANEAGLYQPTRKIRIH